MLLFTKVVLGYLLSYNTSFSGKNDYKKQIIVTQPMYEIFLLYTMFLFSSLITIIIVGTFLIDAFVYLFGERINFKIVSYNISPFGREFCLGQWHAINIVYEYEVSEENYSSSVLNSTNSVMKLSYESANARLLKCLNENKVYVVKSFPKISMLMPFNQDLRYYLGLIFSVSCMIFSGLKIL